jgi:hypothetical protein
MDALAIYVPTTTGRSYFAKGSAIVGRETKFYAWRLMHAADRLMAGGWSSWRSTFRGHSRIGQGNPQTRCLVGGYRQALFQPTNCDGSQPSHESGRSERIDRDPRPRRHPICHRRHAISTPADGRHGIVGLNALPSVGRIDAARPGDFTAPRCSIYPRLGRCSRV